MHFKTVLQKFLQIKKLLGSRDSGSFGSLLFGSGTDFADIREYTFGDEKRSVNRKQSAKYGDLFINQFHQEKGIDVHLVCDINYNRRGKNSDHFMRFFAALSEYFSQEKSHVICYTQYEIIDDVQRAGNAKKCVESVERAIRKTLPFFTSSLHELVEKQFSSSKRKLIVIVSDFFSLEKNDKTQKILLQLAKKHDVKYICVDTDGAKPLIGRIPLHMFSKDM